MIKDELKDEQKHLCGALDKMTELQMVVWLKTGLRSIASGQSLPMRAFVPGLYAIGADPHVNWVDDLVCVYDNLGRGRALFEEGLAIVLADLNPAADSKGANEEEALALVCLDIAQRGGIKSVGRNLKHLTQVVFPSSTSIFVEALWTWRSLAPLTSGLDLARWAVTDHRWRKELAPSVLIGMCEEEPDQSIKHLELFREYIASYLEDPDVSKMVRNEFQQSFAQLLGPERVKELRANEQTILAGRSPKHVIRESLTGARPAVSVLPRGKNAPALPIEEPALTI